MLCTAFLSTCSIQGKQPGESLRVHVVYGHGFIAGKIFAAHVQLIKEDPPSSKNANRSKQAADCGMDSLQHP